jgi:hypothetical protein
VEIVSTAVRFIVLTFVFVAGAITLIGPQLGIGKDVSATQKTVPVENQNNNIATSAIATSAKKPAKKEPDKRGHFKVSTL